MMNDRGPWRRLLGDPLLHLLLLVVGLACLALWHSSSSAQSLGYDPISDAHVIYAPYPMPYADAKLIRRAG